VVTEGGVRGALVEGTAMAEVGKAIGGEAEAVLLPGLYCIEANMLHGLSTSLMGPWTDMAEGTYQVLLRHGLHGKRDATPLRFGRLVAMLRKLPPLSHAGGTILVWRLSAYEIDLATAGPPAEVIAAASLSAAIRGAQEAALTRIIRAVGMEPPSWGGTDGRNGELLATESGHSVT